MRYDKVIGVGGIGTGIFFLSDDNRILGREESRLCHLTNYKDYCKQHIILSYVGKLLKGKAAVYAIGMVGDDGAGDKLRKDMEEDNIIADYVFKTALAPTMTSVCLQYPDGSGCNITSSNSASNRVDTQLLCESADNIGINERTLCVAAPEIPLDARLDFIKYCKIHRAYVAASFSSGEITLERVRDIMPLVDLLAINSDEAAKLGGREDEGEACFEYLRGISEEISLIVTLGGKGSAVYGAHGKRRLPALSSKIVSTAGAGDAYLGATVSGLCLGLPLVKACEDAFFGKSPIGSATELGVLAAHFAVESADTIPVGFCRDSLIRYMKQHKFKCGDVTGVL